MRFSFSDRHDVINDDERAADVEQHDRPANDADTLVDHHIEIYPVELCHGDKLDHDEDGGDVDRAAGFDRREQSVLADQSVSEPGVRGLSGGCGERPVSEGATPVRSCPCPLRPAFRFIPADRWKVGRLKSSP